MRTMREEKNDKREKMREEKHENRKLQRNEKRQNILFALCISFQTSTTPRVGTTAPASTAPGTSSVNCSTVPTASLPSGYQIENIILTTSASAPFNCTQFLAALANDMNLLPQQILVHLATNGNGITTIKFSAPLAFIGPFETKVANGQSSIRNIQSVQREGSTVVIVPPGSGQAWIAGVVIGVVVLGVGVAILVIYLVNKSKHTAGSAPVYNAF